LSSWTRMMMRLITFVSGIEDKYVGVEKYFTCAERF
jgi:hypothetical protein